MMFRLNIPTGTKSRDGMDSLLLKTVAAAALILGAMAVFAAVKLNRDKREARQLTLDAARLDQNDGSINLSDFLTKHKKFMHAISDCNEEQCVYVADLRNGPLPFLHLAPHSEFNIYIIGKEGHVQEIYISVKTAIAGAPFAATMRSASATRCEGGCETFSSGAVVDTSGKIQFSTIELGPRATLADRRIAFQMNADCIFEMRGCSNPSRITGGWPSLACELRCPQTTVR
jgi:hypothetical protein